MSLWVRSKSSLTSPEAAWKCQDQPAKRNKSGVPPLKTHRVWSSPRPGSSPLSPWAPPLRGSRMVEAQSTAQVTQPGGAEDWGWGASWEEGPNPGARRRLSFPAAGARSLTCAPPPAPPPTCFEGRGRGGDAEGGAVATECRLRRPGWTGVWPFKVRPEEVPGPGGAGLSFLVLRGRDRLSAGQRGRAPRRTGPGAPGLALWPWSQ